MEGIEILATKEVATIFSFNWTTFSIAAAVIFTIFLAIGIGFSIADRDVTYVILSSAVAVFIAALFGTFIGALTTTPTEYKTQYKMTISDEVSMNEFLGKYEILDQEGKIYTVRERE